MFCVRQWYSDGGSRMCLISYSIVVGIIHFNIQYSQYRTQKEVSFHVLVPELLH